MKKILILGVKGMLGNKLFEISKSKGYTVLGTILKKSEDENIIGELDIRDYDKIKNVIKEHQPEVVINCIGIINKLCTENNYIDVIEINSLAPHKINKICEDENCRFIHLSTDCVFSGKRGNYSEEDMPDAGDLYGLSKALGEVNYSKNALTIRTSFIGKEEGTKYGLLDWFISQDGKEINGYSKVIWSGLTNIELSKIILRLMEKEAQGLIQVYGESISKYKLLLIIKEVFGLKIKINKFESIKNDRSMTHKKLDSFNIRVPDMRTMIEELYNDYNK